VLAAVQLTPMVLGVTTETLQTATRDCTNRACEQTPPRSERGRLSRECGQHTRA
jgi:hypothetical protein